MKRIQSACLQQTLRFFLKEESLDREEAARTIREEVAHYKAQLERRRIKYKIVEETAQPDGSVILKVKKQYNEHDCGAYLD